MYIFHNSIYDARVLRWNLDDVDFEDTMLMAHILGDLPKKLKHLAYRLLGVQLKDYQDVLGPHERKALLDAVEEAIQGYQPEFIQRISEKTGKPLKPKEVPKPDWYKGLCSIQRSVDPVALYREHISKDRDRYQGTLGFTDDFTLRDIPEGELIDYACGDADVTYRLYYLLRTRLLDAGLASVYALDKACLPVYQCMEETGFLTDPHHFSILSHELEYIMNVSIEELRELSIIDFLPTSSKQTSELLFGKLGLGKGRRLKRTPTGLITTDDAYLQALKHLHPAVQSILNYREAQKLKTTYTDVIPTLLDAGNRYHPDINYCGTVSGRIAERLLILMPKRSSWGMGKRIRQGFIAGAGNLLASWDLSQIELRVLAHASQDPALLEIFRKGGDLHATTAHRVLGAPEKKEHQDESKHRIPAKTLNFAIPMGISAEGLKREIQQALAKDGKPQEDLESWTVDRCQDMLDEWYKKAYRHAGRYLKEKANEAEDSGYVTSFDGRRRFLPAIWSPNAKLRSEAVRQAQSYPMQAGAQHIKKQWMVNIWSHVKREPWVKPLMEIHDDLMFEVKEDQYDQLDQVVQGCLPKNLSVPVLCEGKKGLNWGEMT